MGLLEEYRKYHAPAFSLEPWLYEITELVNETGSVSILDYGAGDSQQYHTEKYHAAWAEKKPAQYEPGLHGRPDRKFDGVICTDLFGRINNDHLQTVCSELSGYATRFLFVVVPAELRSYVSPRLKPVKGCLVEIREDNHRHR